MGKGEGGFEQGFDVWKIVPGITFDYNTDPFVTSQKMTPMAIEMLGDAKNTSAAFRVVPLHGPARKVPVA
ncbi:MAG: hypothetical protein QM757_41130 [Paludibaculum sp.]